MKKIIFICIVFLSMIGGGAPLYSKDVEVRISADLKMDDGEPLVEFSVYASERVEIENAELPWAAPPNLTFILMPVGSGSALKRVYLINSPPYGRTTLSPGSILKGDLRIGGFFPDLLEFNKNQDLLFFWYWTPLLKSRGEPGVNNSSGGWVVIPKMHEKSAMTEK